MTNKFSALPVTFQSVAATIRSNGTVSQGDVTFRFQVDDNTTLSVGMMTFLDLAAATCMSVSDFSAEHCYNRIRDMASRVGFNATPVAGLDNDAMTYQGTMALLACCEKLADVGQSNFLFMETAYKETVDCELITQDNYHFIRTTSPTAVEVTSSRLTLDSEVLNLHPSYGAAIQFTIKGQRIHQPGETFTIKLVDANGDPAETLRYVVLTEFNKADLMRDYMRMVDATDIIAYQVDRCRFKDTNEFLAALELMVESGYIAPLQETTPLYYSKEQPEILLDE